MSKEMITLLGSIGLELLVAIVGFIIFLINNKKKKIELELQKQETASIKALAEKNQMDLETYVCLSSYTHCPKCGEKLYFRDLDFNVGGKNDEIQKKI